MKRFLLGLLALAWAAGASAEDPMDPGVAGLPTVTRQIWEKGAREEKAGHFDKAAIAYNTVLRAEPSFSQARVALGRVLEAGGRDGDAESIYSGSYDSDVRLALGRLLLRQERWGDAEDLLASVCALGLTEGCRLEAVAVSKRDAPQAADLFIKYLRLSLQDPDPDVVTADALAIAHAVAPVHPDLATELLGEVLTRFPDAGPQIDALVDRLDMVAVARRLAAVRPEDLDASEAVALREGEAALAAGRVDEARQTLGALADRAPANAEVQSALADACLRLADVACAHRALLAAEALSPLEPTHPARLGELLASEYGGRFDAAAAEAYGRALRLDPTRPSWWSQKAVLDAGLGHVEAARASWQRVIALSPGEPLEVIARTALVALDRTPPDAPVFPAPAGPPEGISQEAWEAYNLARAYYARGNPVTAPDVKSDKELGDIALGRARALAPKYVPAINLEAQSALSEGGAANRERAIDLLRDSLELEAEQAPIVVLLGSVLDAEGHTAEAVELWQRAAKIGGPGGTSAHYHLAERAWSKGSYWEAERHLDAYFVGPGTADVTDRERATELSRLVRNRIYALYGGVGGFLLLAVLVPLLVVLYRRQGVSVETMLARSPDAWREVAGVFSLIRHEILKHNTTVLPSVADALEDLDPEPARWAADRLFGKNAALERFSSHVRQLEAVGSRHGSRLNLRHRDPVFGPLLKAIRRLQRLESAMRRGAGRQLADDLRELSTTLNGTSYRALGALIRRVALLTVDEDLVIGVWERVRRELTEGQAEFSLDFGDRPVSIRIYRSELEDILANLLRNAAQADSTTGRVGIAVAIEEDEVTGLQRVAFRVRDDAPKRITTAMIRGRYIERGLGLTVDLISRNGGSVHVEDEPGWSKSVVVRLPLEENKGET